MNNRILIMGSALYPARYPALYPVCHPACAFLFAILAAALPVSAQTVSSGPGSLQPQAPYTAEFHITTVRTLANGGTITREVREVEARDSQGRVVTATTPIPASDSQPAITNAHVQLLDRTNLNWDSRSKIVRVVHMPPPGTSGCFSTVPSTVPVTSLVNTPAIGGPTPTPSADAVPDGVGAGTGGGTGVANGAASSGTTGVVLSSRATGVPLPPRPTSVQQDEDLGADVIMGVEVRGRRVTLTTPVGRVGNDVPLVRTVETWRAPSLGAVLRRIVDDPRTGKSDFEVVSLDLNEPDPSVFAPPEGYQVIDEEMHQIPCHAAQ